jgi:hypothetical protein
MRFLVSDSDTGDVLGVVEVDDDASDETLLQALCDTGYLQASADDYEITEGDLFAEPNALTVRDEEGPMLVLEPDDSDENGEDNDAEEIDL